MSAEARRKQFLHECEITRIKAKLLCDLAVAYTNKQTGCPYAPDTIQYISEVYKAIFGEESKEQEKGGEQ
jgi:hypothetical protein